MHTHMHAFMDEYFHVYALHAANLFILATVGMAVPVRPRSWHSGRRRGCIWPSLERRLGLSGHELCRCFCLGWVRRDSGGLLCSRVLLTKVPGGTPGL